MSERLNTFLKLSARLTGVSQLQLLGTGVGSEFLDSLDKVLSSERLGRLLTAFAQVESGTEQSLSREILENPELGPVARNVIVMWYCGTWEQLPDEWRSTYGRSPLDEPHVVSQAAYLAGLQWRIVGAHPSGGAPQGFGSWSSRPEGSPS